MENVYALSPEDLIAIKLRRYSAIDRDDIQGLMAKADVDLLGKVIEGAFQSLANAKSREIYLKNVKWYYFDMQISAKWGFLDV